MKVLICGDRYWNNVLMIEDEIFKLDCPTIIEGGCPTGADFIANTIARRLGLTIITYPANWSAYGKAAGPKRNQKMLDEGKPDLVLAFHNNIGESKGTKDMLKRAMRAGITSRLLSEPFTPKP